MQFTFFFSWETVVVIFCLLALLGGLVRLTARRQTEILTEYLQPEHLHVEQLILRLGSTLPNSPESEQHSDATSDSPTNSKSQ